VLGLFTRHVLFATILFVSTLDCSHGTVHLSMVMFTWYYSSHHRYCSCCSSRPPCGSLHRAVTMPDDTKAAALRARIEAIVNEAEDAEAQDVAASRPPASSRKRSPRPSPWSRRLQLPVSACHLRRPRPRPRSSSPPPLRPIKTRSSLDFTFRWLQCSMSVSW
jgi:hypothetical protein